MSGPAEALIRRFRLAADGKVLEYQVRKSEMAAALGDLEEAGSLALLDRYLRSLEEDR
jgi:hypothetical protein